MSTIPSRTATAQPSLTADSRRPKACPRVWPPSARPVRRDLNGAGPSFRRPERPYRARMAWPSRGVVRRAAGLCRGDSPDSARTTSWMRRRSLSSRRHARCANVGRRSGWDRDPGQRRRAGLSGTAARQRDRGDRDSALSPSHLHDSYIFIPRRDVPLAAKDRRIDEQASPPLKE
jgi:hypothetical protein